MTEFEKVSAVVTSTSLRVSSYIVGIGFGLYIAKILQYPHDQENKQGKMWKKVIGGSAVALAMMLCVDLSKIVSPESFATALSVLQSIFKINFASLTGFVILYCQYGETTSKWNKFLSANVFKILSKLCFSLHLIHPVILAQQITVHSKTETVHNPNKLDFAVSLIGYVHMWDIYCFDMYT